MPEYRLGEVEMKFAEIIWENEPVSSGELARMSAEKLQWKKSTTYTVLKRLCDKGIFQNENGMVRSLISLKEFKGKRSEEFVEDTFAGSLPDFVAAFVSQKKLSDREIKELWKVIEESRQ